MSDYEDKGVKMAGKYSLQPAHNHDEVYVKIGEGGGVTEWTSWTPTQSGWTALPTGTYRYFQVGKMCFFAIDITAGTSNSNLAVLSLPVAAKSGTFWGGVNGMAMNNGTVLSVASKWYIDASSGNIAFGTDMGSGLWATSGTKRIRCEGFYEIA